MEYIRELFRATIATDRAAVSLTTAIRTGLIVAAVLAACFFSGNPALCAGMSIGVVFVTVADPGGSYRHRLHAILLGSVLFAVATFVGGLVSNVPVLHIVTVTACAFVAGFLCCTGPRGAMIGVLSLVILVVFSGDSGNRHNLVVNTVACALGCAVIVVTVCVPWVLRRAGGVRGQLALFFRGMAVAIATGPDAMYASLHAERLRAVQIGAEFDGHAGRMKEWIAELIDCSVRFRMSVVALSSYLQESPPASPVASYVEATSQLSHAVAQTLVWHGRKRRLLRALDVFDRAHTACAAFDPGSAVLFAATHDSLRQVATSVAGPWPIGRGSGVRLPTIRPLAPFDLRSHFVWSDPFLRHGVRLSLAMAIALVIDVAMPFPHAYWVGLTVAWVARPGFGDTTLKVVSRTTGTVIGILITVGLAVVLPMHHWDMAVVIALSTVVVIAFLVPNYAICIGGLTVFVVFLDALQVNDIVGISAYRLLGTAAGGLLVMAVARLWPLSFKGTVCGSLASYASAMESYATTLLSDGGFDDPRLDPLRADLLSSRSSANASVTAAAHEPGKHLLHVGDATQVLIELNRIGAEFWKWELERHVPEGMATRAEVTSALHLVADQLHQLEATGHVEQVTTDGGDRHNGSTVPHVSRLTGILESYI